MPNERSTAVELGADMMEVVIDESLEDGLLKDVPLLGSAVKIANLTRSVRDRLFLAKLKRFVEEAARGTSQAERQKFTEQLLADEELRKRAGMLLVVLLDRFADIDKPTILARLYVCLVRGKISVGDFRRLGSAVDTADIEDLHLLAAPSQSSRKQDFMESLIPSGLVSFSSHGVPAQSAFGEIAMHVIHSAMTTRLGNQYIECMKATEPRTD